MRARGVARGGSVGGSQIGRSVNPIQTRGEIMPHTLLPAPRIQKAIYTSAALVMDYIFFFLSYMYKTYGKCNVCISVIM